MEMKNVIKKIASIAMAFTLLGTGTAVTKTISPKFDNTLVASAKEKTWYKAGTWKRITTIQKNGRKDVFSDSRGIVVYTSTDKEGYMEFKLYIPNCPSAVYVYRVKEVQYSGYIKW